ncbi:hypothetical protein [Botrimarina mediterranea]|uniref:Uncharacterized protein n=1 Tax=Botrimarina mediterranea TaxID=2528022 RepID=A0A518KBM9_9BACT|nr:hypothetical protein [Botrimarina mediterranea]QDV75190.1 hypothetical protein Spa11_34030 [Botrimarina mediterranea]QDV79836.1 hypothetical protein K2D_34550 [Planctomycetes bacterium K2D]
MSTPFRPADESIDDWGACAPGTLTGLGHSLRANRSRQATTRVATRLASVAAASVAAVAIFVLTLQPTETPAAATRINCRACNVLMPAYYQQLTQKDAGAPPIKAEEATKMTEHLHRCGGCRRKFETKYPGALASNL